MKAPVSWLKEYVPVEDAHHLAESLAITGTEVEQVELLGQGLDHVVAGRLEQIHKHPNADRLLVCQVNIGEQQIQIVTGAPNVTEGMMVPVALPGAHLPGMAPITKGKLRGEVSEGMLCSIAELELKKEDYPDAPEDGIMPLAADIVPGTPMRNILGLDDAVLEISVLANRPDCMSILGIAREAAASMGKPFTAPQVHVREEGKAPSGEVTLTVEDTALCPRYLARLIRNVHIAPSPEWMARRLTAAGVRPICNIVDITNYVMLEFGQPLHAFDLRDIRGGKLSVRRAYEGETLVTIDEKKRELTGDMLVIADGEGAIGLAGIMGGLNSEIRSDTCDVLLEAAAFSGPNLRATCRKLGMHTEASARFVKGIDIHAVSTALDRAAQLVEMLEAGEVAKGRLEQALTLPAPITVSASVSDISRLLGMDIPAETMQELLNRAHLPCILSDGVLEVSVPSFRQDVSGMADLAEEVLRLYGYDRIPMTLPNNAAAGGRTPRQNDEEQMRQAACALGYHEAFLFSFVSPASYQKAGLDASRCLRVINPLGEDTSLMRDTLLPSLLEALSLNVQRGAAQGRLFELSRVYRAQSLPLNELPSEPVILSLGLFGSQADFFSLKSDVESLLERFRVNQVRFMPQDGMGAFHPGQCARLILGASGKDAGVLGRLHPDVCEAFGLPPQTFAAQLELDVLLAAAQHHVTYKPLARFPAVARDLSCQVASSQMAGPMLEAIAKAAGAVLETVDVFDVYTGPQVAKGYKSIAFSLVFRAADHTLVEEEVAKAMSRVLAALEHRFQAQLRT